MAHGERRVVDERRVVTARAHLLGPDPPRDVDQHPAAVALTVDVAGAVEHLLEAGEGQLHRLATRGRVLAHRRIERARVVIINRGRRDQGPPRQVRRVTIQLDLPGTAPSSSGRAAGSGEAIIRPPQAAYSGLDGQHDRRPLAEGRHRQDDADEDPDRRLRAPRARRPGRRRRPAGQPLRLLRHRRATPTPRSPRCSTGRCAPPRPSTAR